MIFTMVSRPRDIPTSTAATRLALAGRTSSRATPSSASTGMRANAAGVTSLNWFGTRMAATTTMPASTVTDHPTTRRNSLGALFGVPSPGVVSGVSGVSSVVGSSSLASNVNSIALPRDHQMSAARPRWSRHR